MAARTERERLAKIRFGNSLTERRKALGLSQKQLAEIVGASQPSVADWEAGKTRPRPRAVEELARALGCEPSDLNLEGRLEINKNEKEAANYLRVARELSKQHGVDDELALYAGLYRSVLRVFHSQRRSVYSPQILLDYCGGMQPGGATAAAVATKVIWDRARKGSVFTSLDEGVVRELSRFQSAVDMMELPYNVEADPFDDLELELRKTYPDTDTD